MTSRTETLDIASDRVRRRALDFLELTKPRVVLMVLVTTTVGFYLGSQGEPDYVSLLHTLFGTALAGGGTLALNQLLEREADAKMNRTRLRPLPDGRLQPIDALVFGALITAGGLVYLTLAVNALSAQVTAAIVVSYLFAYTPLKKKTSLCSLVGAIPGALPPVIGWAAPRPPPAWRPWVFSPSLFSGQIPPSLP